MSIKISGGDETGIQSYPVETIAASGSINSISGLEQYRPVVGDGGAVTASTTPFGTGGAWVSGTAISIVGTDNTNTVTVPNNDAQYGAMLNGAAVLAKDFILELFYDSVRERWIERGRNF